MLTFSNLAELSEELLNKYFSLTKAFEQLKTRFVENQILKPNVFYTGPMNESHKPHGIGMLFYENYYIKLIREFNNGEIKYNLGYTILSNDIDRFGLFDDCFTKGPILQYYDFPKYKGRMYYLGESVINLHEGIGKESYLNGRFRIGEWDNNKITNYQKEVQKNGSFFEGEANDKSKKSIRKYFNFFRDYYE